jgi:hypothetical protein
MRAVRGAVGIVVFATVLAGGLASSVGAASTVTFANQAVGTTGAPTPVPLPLRSTVNALPAGTIVYNGGDPFLTTGLALSGVFVPVSAGALVGAFGDASLVPTVTGVSLGNGAASDFLLASGDCVGSTAASCSASGRFMPKATGPRSDTAEPVFSNVSVTGAGWDPDLEGAIGPYFVPVLEQFDAVGLQGTGLAGPTVVVSPSSGAPGTPVTVQGSAFPVGDTVVVKYKTGLVSPPAEVLCATTVLAGGTFSCSGSIPTAHHGAAGPHVLVAKASPSLDKAKATFTLS